MLRLNDGIKFIASPRMFFSKADKGVNAEDTVIVGLLWCPCLDSWEGAKSFICHHFCAISANADPMNRSKDTGVWLGKYFWSLENVCRL